MKLRVGSGVCNLSARGAEKGTDLFSLTVNMVSI